MIFLNKKKYKSKTLTVCFRQEFFNSPELFKLSTSPSCCKFPTPRVPLPEDEDAIWDACQHLPRMRTTDFPPKNWGIVSAFPGTVVTSPETALEYNFFFTFFGWSETFYCRPIRNTLLLVLFNFLSCWTTRGESILEKLFKRGAQSRVFVTSAPVGGSFLHIVDGY